MSSKKLRRKRANRQRVPMLEQFTNVQMRIKQRILDGHTTIEVTLDDMETKSAFGISIASWLRQYYPHVTAILKERNAA